MAGIQAGIKIVNGMRQGMVVFPMADDVSFGRLETVDVFLPDTKCSRTHARVLLRDDHYVIVDLSANGTYVNERRLDRDVEVRLYNGDVLRMGATKVEFRVAGAPAAAPTSAPVPAGVAPTPTQDLLPPTMASRVQSLSGAPVEFEFDFSEDDKSTGGGLDKVFDTKKIKRFSTEATQEMKAYDPEDLEFDLD